MMARLKRTPAKSPTSKEKNTTKIRVENSWILLINNQLFENDNFNIITLPHPGRGLQTKYCLDDTLKKVYEVITFNEPYRSWFVGETVKSNGNLLMVTPMNPLFLILPKLKEQCSNKAIPLKDLLSEKGFDKLFDFITGLDSLADLKGPSDMKAYKYNEDKTLTWLENRVRKLAVTLKSKNVQVASGAVSATFVASNINNQNLDEEFYLKYSFGIISEYLQNDIAELLEKKFNFQTDLIESIGKKRKSELEELKETNKKIKCELAENGSPDNSFLSKSSIAAINSKQKPLTSKEKARQKAATGTKTISAFFSKK